MEEEFVKMREEAGVKILAKGFDTQNERVYVVQDMDSMEVIQNAMAKNQEKIKEAGVDMSTMQMIPLDDWFKRLITSVESIMLGIFELKSWFTWAANLPISA